MPFYLEWAQAFGQLDTKVFLFPGHADTPPGKYRLLVGMYRPEDTTNLVVCSAPATLPGNRLDLGEITITTKPN
jgi:hypothetical protein